MAETATMLRRRAVTPLREGLAAEIADLDLSRALTPEEVGFISAAFLRYPVLVFHGQNLGPVELSRFGESFGRLEPHSLLKYRHPDYPALSFVTNVDKDGKLDTFGYERRAVDFHSDGSFKALPDAITVLHALEVPTVGGNTIFSDMYLAYDSLAPDMKQRLDGLAALHKRAGGIRGSSGTLPTSPEIEAQYPGSVHPIVRTHPDTGRKAIYVNPIHTVRVVGLSEEESANLLDYLYSYCAQPEFQYAHRWTVGDVVMWDQRCTMHRAAGGAPPDQRRVLLRTMIVTGPAPA